MSIDPKFAFCISLCALLAVHTTDARCAEVDSSEDEHIRRIVGELLQNKEKQMVHLERRVQELERLTRSQKDVIDRLEEEKAKKDQTVSSTELAKSANADAEPKVAAGSEPAANDSAKSPLAKLLLPAVKKQVAVEKEDQESGPKVGGFLDVTAQTKSSSTETFHLGNIELDLERIMESEHFAASAALNWYGYGVSPEVTVGAGFVDFHLYDYNVPLRGRIFQEPGFHIQAGKFDLPFSSDYQFFAARDRLTIAPPITTRRIQGSGINPSNGGFNSTGVRTYGNWNNLSYALFWVDGVYSEGTSTGGRIGGFVSNPYRLHNRSELPILDAGLSVLIDLDKNEHLMNQVYAVDFALNYDIFRLFSEFLWRDSKQLQFDSNGEAYAAPDEYAYHVTLAADLEKWLKQKVNVYGRYEVWHPNYSYAVSGDDLLAYSVETIPGMTVGLGYRFNDYLIFKLEYSDTFGRQTQEPGFQKRMGFAQLVASF